MERREAFQTGKGVRLQPPAGIPDRSDEKDGYGQQNKDYRNVKDCEADFPGGGARHLIGIDRGAAQVLCRRARQPFLHDLPQLHRLPLRGGHRLRLECQPGLPDGRDGGQRGH